MGTRDKFRLSKSTGQSTLLHKAHTVLHVILMYATYKILSLLGMRYYIIQLTLAHTCAAFVCNCVFFLYNYYLTLLEFSQRKYGNVK